MKALRLIFFNHMPGNMDLHPGQMPLVTSLVKIREWGRSGDMQNHDSVTTYVTCDYVLS